MSRRTVSLPVCFGIKLTTRFLLQLRVCWCEALSLTRGRVCRLQLLLVLASAVILGSESRGTHDHVLMSPIPDFPFRHLLRLTGLRWRYSRPPPHGTELPTLNTSFTNMLHGPNIKHRFQQCLYCRTGVFTWLLHRNGSSTVACAPILAGTCFTELLPSNSSLHVSLLHNNGLCMVQYSLPLTHSWSWALFRSRQLCSCSRTCQHFMEPEGSSPCSQEPSTGSYPLAVAKCLSLCIRPIELISYDLSEY
jgi:hypothetical protein